VGQEIAVVCMYYIVRSIWCTMGMGKRFFLSSIITSYAGIPFRKSEISHLSGGVFLALSIVVSCYSTILCDDLYPIVQKSRTFFSEGTSPFVGFIRPTKMTPEYHRGFVIGMPSFFVTPVFWPYCPAVSIRDSNRIEVEGIDSRLLCSPSLTLSPFRRPSSLRSFSISFCTVVEGVF
jgi:hypothetical protein